MREQWYCENCGQLYFAEEPPDICGGCRYATDRAPHRQYGDRETEFHRVHPELDDEIEAIEETEECPECGAMVDPESIEHELGGAWCPECAD